MCEYLYETHPNLRQVTTKIVGQLLLKEITAIVVDYVSSFSEKPPLFATLPTTYRGVAAQRTWDDIKDLGFDPVDVQLGQVGITVYASVTVYNSYFITVWKHPVNPLIIGVIYVCFDIPDEPEDASTKASGANIDDTKGTTNCNIKTEYCNTNTELLIEQTIETCPSCKRSYDIDGAYGDCISYKSDKSDKSDESDESDKSDQSDEKVLVYNNKRFYKIYLLRAKSEQEAFVGVGNGCHERKTILLYDFPKEFQQLKTIDGFNANCNQGTTNLLIL